MAQNWWLPFAGTTKQNQAIKTLLAESMESVRTFFAGSTAPVDPVPYMHWADTGSTPPMMRMRNAANSAWIALYPISVAFAQQLASQWVTASLSATKTDTIGIASRASIVQRLVFVCGTASTSSSGNEWRFVLKRYPFSAPGSPVDLFSGNVGTFTALGGVGGGAETVANKAYFLTPNQNQSLVDGDRLELQLTKVGTATTLVDAHAFVEVL